MILTIEELLPPEWERNQRYGEAFKVMSLVKPNVVVLTSVMGCCFEELDLLTGKQVHCGVVRRCFTFDTQLCNVLLDMYAKCRKILLARSVFDGICRKDVISWTCMIDVYGRNGCGYEAIKLFKKMAEDRSEVLYPCNLRLNYGLM
ncbi:pentatricopeptide repeat-containing protein, mitochondrial [Trifolium repens]|nr:pentatricopeptide repeat-containing protein, mitochondrial [Trifolium repens]